MTTNRKTAYNSRFASELICGGAMANDVVYRLLPGEVKIPPFGFSKNVMCTRKINTENDKTNFVFNNSNLRTFL